MAATTQHTHMHTRAHTHTHKHTHTRTHTRTRTHTHTHAHTHTHIHVYILCLCRLDAGTFATMGLGSGYAIAASLIVRDSTHNQSGLKGRVFCIQGDSAFGFSGMELEVACRYSSVHGLSITYFSFHLNLPFLHFILLSAFISNSNLFPVLVCIPTPIPPLPQVQAANHIHCHE